PGGAKPCGGSWWKKASAAMGGSGRWPRPCRPCIHPAATKNGPASIRFGRHRLSLAKLYKGTPHLLPGISVTAFRTVT
ncbi:MAG TPA: hypothetical protein PLT20_12450, partial [Sedimentisphaerales bacterium]|nr:hypothetical protein [Sedimentisphaerales bacterium]